MKTPIHLNNKGNEIITQGSFDIKSCFLLNSHCRCMCCHCQSLSHHIYASQVNNDNVHQSSKIISSNKNIHSPLNVTREKVKDLLLKMCSAFQNNNYNNIPKCVMGYCIFILTRALKQMGT